MKTFYKYFFSLIPIASAFILPVSIVYGQGSTAPRSTFSVNIPEADGTIGGFFEQLAGILNGVIGLIMALALVFFLWGVAMYVVSKNQEDQAKAKGYMIWGIIGLVVMVGVWGIVAILTGTFFSAEDLKAPPAIPSL